MTMFGVLTKIGRVLPSLTCRTRLLPILNNVQQALSYSILSATQSQPKNALLKTVPPLLSQVCGLKMKGRLRRRCKDCYFVWRQERLYVMCKTHPRHKQMSMKKREYNTWILTTATQGPIRGW